MRGLRQSLAAAATKCGGDLEPHRDCLYVATSRYLVSRVEWKCRIHDVSEEARGHVTCGHTGGPGQEGGQPGQQPHHPARHVSRVTCDMIC